MPHPASPAQAWAALLEGNERFVRGQMQHPAQDIDHRAQISAGQNPFAVVFGCSDSRVAAEIVFDRGLGDLFVVRTAGHVVDTTVVGSIEYGVEVLGAPLVIVLGHDSCGAVGAAADALATGRMPGGFVRAVVDRVIPSIVGLSDTSSAALGREHVRHTVQMLQAYSAALSRGIQEGRCAVVGAEYALEEGRVRAVEVIGDVASAGSASGGSMRP